MKLNDLTSNSPICLIKYWFLKYRIIFNCMDLLPLKISPFFSFFFPLYTRTKTSPDQQSESLLDPFKSMIFSIYIMSARTSIPSNWTISCLPCFTIRDDVFEILAWMTTCACAGMHAHGNPIWSPSRIAGKRDSLVNFIPRSIGSLRSVQNVCLSCELAPGLGGGLHHLFV